MDSKCQRVCSRVVLGERKGRGREQARGTSRFCVNGEHGERKMLCSTYCVVPVVLDYHPSDLSSATGGRAAVFHMDTQASGRSLEDAWARAGAQEHVRLQVIGRGRGEGQGLTAGVQLRKDQGLHDDTDGEKGERADEGQAAFSSGRLQTLDPTSG